MTSALSGPHLGHRSVVPNGPTHPFVTHSHLWTCAKREGAAKGAQVHLGSLSGASSPWYTDASSMLMDRCAFCILQAAVLVPDWQDACSCRQTRRCSGNDRARAQSISRQCARTSCTREARVCLNKQPIKKRVNGLYAIATS